MTAFLRALVAVARRRPRPARFLDLSDHLRRDIGLPQGDGAGLLPRVRVRSPS